MRCGVCGLTLVEEHPLNGGKETVWRLDESDYGPEGSHPVIQSSKENSTSKKTKPAHSGGKDRNDRKDRPRGKPFDEPERKYLCSLDIIDACTEKRITWNKTFIEYAEKELEAGSRPVDIFRGAGVGPELIGRKRIERCVARWRAKIKKEEQQ